MDALDEGKEKLHRAEMRRKRVHFADNADSDDDADKKVYKVRFPKARKDKDSKKLDLTDIEKEEFGGVVKAKDPRLAAKERAVWRQLTGEPSGADDAVAVDEMGPAEEEFEGTAEEEAEFEPFNLKKEREEGYFDPEGNYVEYTMQNEIRDAWLDSVEVNTRYAERAAALDLEEEEQEPEKELTSADLAAIKRRIADVLQPGETVLHGLRRLGGGVGKQKEKGKKGAPSEKEERMPEGNKALFDKLTEDSMKLMDHGEYNVYSDKQETFQREAEGYENLQRARSQLMSADASADDDDIFGDDEPRKAAASNPPASTSNGADRGEVPQPPSVGGVTDADSGYVYDETSGYYYSSALGYYYDSSTGLFCSASSGIWYKYDEESSSYVEVPAAIEQDPTGAVGAHAAT
eukprot:TRINITY_DN9314_c0_g1_i1.p1 TRINITY_DN9314_c0_g1~~TRINITY_DN9314_c0_g1_i1.p1  ORF type:complete len:443 (-),score=126.92 TRINITY_DN9314_c0_g1_i1:263-1477(-)